MRRLEGILKDQRVTSTSPAQKPSRSNKHDVVNKMRFPDGHLVRSSLDRHGD